MPIGKPVETKNFIRVQLNPSYRYVALRTHDIGRKGFSKRIAGKTIDGKWETQGYLISKKEPIQRFLRLLGQMEYQFKKAGKFDKFDKKKIYHSYVKLNKIL